MEIDSPWLLEEGGRLLVNVVDIVPLVDAELNRRFPGRESRMAADPTAWATVEATWAATLDRATAMPAGTVDATVDDEWSLAQTRRHLVTATDTWLGKAILEREQPHHPAVLPNDDHDTEAYDESAFSAEPPSFEQVLQARAEQQAMVRDFLFGLSASLPSPLEIRISYIATPVCRPVPAGVLRLLGPDRLLSRDFLTTSSLVRVERRWRLRLDRQDKQGRMGTQWHRYGVSTTSASPSQTSTR